MLQSVLYYTGSYNQQYWLTPFIYYLLENDNEQTVLAELEKIDNLMLPGEKKDISWKLTNQNSRNEKVDSQAFSILNEPAGVHFNHYWFYKFEYLLWKKWEQEELPKLKEREKELKRFKRFRITSKNSIEHVFPQNHEFSKKLENNNDFDWLNSFGNLGLLSVGQNSSYSDQDVKKKKIDFDNKPTYDSLKLAKIYSENVVDWGIKKIEEHKTKMIELLKNHYE